MNDERTESLQLEQNELQHMINEGVTFDVEITTYKRKPGFFGFFRKREKVKETKVFKIKEPTLNTLDRLSAIWIDMAIDEARLNDEDYLRTAKQLAAKEAKKLAKVVAVAVLGEDYYITQNGDYSRAKEDVKELNRLTTLFFHTVTPSQLLTLAILITNVSNLGGFINSMRLMSATRTSEPTNRIEQQG